MRWAWRGKPHTRGRRCWMTVASTHCARCRRGAGLRGLMMRSCRPWGACCCKARPRTASAPSCGHSSAWAFSSNGYTASSSARRRSGASSAGWVSQRKSPSAVPSSATMMLLRPGSARLGPGSKKARRVGRLIVFIDESELGEQPTRVRTRAPKGQTPIIQFHFNWTHISVIAGPAARRSLLRWRAPAASAPSSPACRPSHRVP